MLRHFGKTELQRKHRFSQLAVKIRRLDRADLDDFRANRDRRVFRHRDRDLLGELGLVRFQRLDELGMNNFHRWSFNAPARPTRKTRASCPASPVCPRTLADFRSASSNRWPSFDLAAKRRPS